MANDRLDVVIFGASGFSKYTSLFIFIVQQFHNVLRNYLKFISIIPRTHTHTHSFSYTAGKYTVLEGVKLLENLSWGVAGRDEEKLKRTLKEVGDKVGKDLSTTPIIVADVKDENSLQKMAERAKVINRCFPNSFTKPTLISQPNENHDVITYLFMNCVVRKKKKKK